MSLVVLCFIAMLHTTLARWFQAAISLSKETVIIKVIRWIFHCSETGNCPQHQLKAQSMLKGGAMYRAMEPVV